MKKNKFRILVSLGIIASSLTGVSAATASINSSVPTAQGYKTVTSKSKTQTTNYGTVRLTKKEPDAVSFSAKNNGGSYGSVTTVTQTGTTYRVNYTGTF